MTHIWSVAETATPAAAAARLACFGVCPAACSVLPCHHFAPLLSFIFARICRCSCPAEHEQRQQIKLAASRCCCRFCSSSSSSCYVVSLLSSFSFWHEINLSLAHSHSRLNTNSAKARAALGRFSCSPRCFCLLLLPNLSIFASATFFRSTFECLLFHCIPCKRCLRLLMKSERYLCKFLKQKLPQTYLIAV